MGNQPILGPAAAFQKEMFKTVAFGGKYQGVVFAVHVVKIVQGVPQERRNGRTVDDLRTFPVFIEEPGEIGGIEILTVIIAPQDE